MKACARYLLVFLVVSLVALCSGCPPKSWVVPPDAPPIQSPQKDFTLVWDKTDANGAPLDPYWALEKTQNEIPPREAGSHPYPCELDPFSDQCTENPTPVQDLPEFPNAVICEVGNTEAKIHGHADWLVASQQGCVKWEEQSTDGDYNFHLFPWNPKRSGLTKNNDNFIGLEFDFYESLVNAQLPFWRDFIAQVEAENESQDSTGPEQEIRKLLHPADPNTNPRAMVLGLFGVDCEHGCKSEVHPVLGFAVETNASADDDTWMLFVRNWGDQGFCSHLRHLVDFPGNQVSILLFDDPDSDGPTVIPEKTKMFASEGSNMSFPTLSYLPGRGPVLTFNFPAPEQQQVMAEMEIHYRWSKFNQPSCGAGPIPVMKPPVGAAAQQVSTEAQTAEEYLGQLHRMLRTEKPTMIKALRQARPRAPLKMVEVKKPERFAMVQFAPPVRPMKAKRGELPRDLRKRRQDVTDIQQLCEAKNGKLPLFHGKDLSAELCDQKKLAKELKNIEKESKKTISPQP